MIILSSIEVWRGGAAAYNFYNMNGGSLTAGNITPSTNPYQAKFAIPLVIAIVAGVIFLMTGCVTLNLCCCMETLGIYLPAAPAPAVMQQPAPAVVTKEVYYPPRPQVRTQYAVDYPPVADVDPYSRYSGFMPATRYSGANVGPNVMVGNFPSRAPAPNSFASDFFQPNPAYFWK